MPYLEIRSEPPEISFILDGVYYATPHADYLTLGPHTIIMPQTFTLRDINYNFVQWEDGSTTPTRTIDLVVDTYITATYEAVAPPPPEAPAISPTILLLALTAVGFMYFITKK